MTLLSCRCVISAVMSLVVMTSYRFTFLSFVKAVIGFCDVVIKTSKDKKKKRR